MVAKSILPSFVEKIIDSGALGVIVEELSIYSHSAILLKEANIPTLISKTINSKEAIILDTLSGVIVPNPTKDDLILANRRTQEYKKSKDIAFEHRFDKAITKKDREIKVLANIGDLASAQKAKSNGADGVGLFRSEFLFTEKKPSLEEQIKSYREIFELFDDITIRTLDVGGDKKLPYIKIDKEDNPFLGIRGIRLLTTHREIIKEQIKAILLASNNIKIMFPMISNIDEFKEAKNLSIKIAKENNIDISNIKFGMMIEVPSVLYMLDEFDKLVDFYSIGTNDLIQYLFATDRTHQSLKIEDISIVFKIIKDIKAKTTKPLSICGEIAGDNIDKLLEIGIDTISLSSNLIPQTKEYIRNV